MLGTTPESVSGKVAQQVAKWILSGPQQVGFRTIMVYISLISTTPMNGATTFPKELIVEPLGFKIAENVVPSAIQKCIKKRLK